MRMYENPAFMRMLRDYDKYKNTKEGKETFRELEDSNDFPAFPPPTEEEIEQQKIIEKLLGGEPRIYFNVICPSCREESEYTIQNTQMAMIGLYMMRGLCPRCNKNYSIINNIVKEKSKKTLGCLFILAVIIIIFICSQQ